MAVFVLYLLFFLSGAAALVYEVAWVRSLSLVFGGSHLAVTAVLSVFMGGLALGSKLLGKRADASERPLRLYGTLEIGVAVFAVVFVGLTKIYPVIYAPLARVAADSRLYLSVVRVVFGVTAMIVPTTLMGGTLPVLSGFVARKSENIGRHLSFLYGFNTLGAVAGSLAAGFLLLKTLGVTATIAVAVVINLAVGLVAISIPERAFAKAMVDRTEGRARAASKDETGAIGDLSSRLVLWGIGVSGFCALGYEVLWTRMLTLVLGTSVYAFTIILVAFLAGIGLGSEAYGLAQRRAHWRLKRSVLGFGLVQIAIGLAAVTVTILMRELPSHATWLRSLFFVGESTEFAARQAGSFFVAVAYVFVPAFFMGVAFPLAGTVHAAHSRAAGGAVGEILTYNTIGAILGSAVSGFLLLYLFGIERSLQMLAVLNVGIGLSVVASTADRKPLQWPVATGTALLLVALSAFPHWGRFWDLKYFAIFRNNQRGVFDTPELRKDALENTDVLYYFEGANETISVIRPRGAQQAFLVNGRPEASTAPADVQCQRTLGHLPMLLHENPRRVFVLGTGTGMTLGATSIHPEVKSIVLAEIEPGVLGATRTFAEYNHGVLDDPKLRIVFNDGRNYLNTTHEMFDVVTADPIHPWSGGAAYLYTTEYFRSVAEHLLPGGIACQWLPLYELTAADVKTVLRTFGESFKFVMVWLTHYDAQLIGSNAPVLLDEAKLARRIAHPAIREDLQAVDMGSAEDFLSYFVLGTQGAREFARDGVVNTDDNLWLEFSAPKSMGKYLVGDNVASLARHRESIVPYLVAPAADTERSGQRARWDRNLEAGRAFDPVHAVFTGAPERSGGPREARARLDRDFPSYAPFRFLEKEEQRNLSGEPRLVDRVGFPVTLGGSAQRIVQVSAVKMRIGKTRAVVVFVDNERRVTYGQRYFDGREDELDGTVARFAADTLVSLQAAYAEAAVEALRRGQALPPEALVVRRLKERVAARVADRAP